MSMYNPAHPGEILKDLILDPLQLSITKAAYHLDISQTMLSQIVSGHSAITPDIALRLEIIFKNPNATHWLRLQNAFDIWQARKRFIHTIPISEIPHVQNHQAPHHSL